MDEFPEKNFERGGNFPIQIHSLQICFIINGDFGHKYEFTEKFAP